MYKTYVAIVCTLDYFTYFDYIKTIRARSANEARNKIAKKVKGYQHIAELYLVENDKLILMEV